MGSVIFIIFVIAVIVSALNKQKKAQQSEEHDKSKASYSSSYPDDSSYRSSSSFKRTGGTSGSTMKAKASTGTSSATRKAEERARENMKDTELKNRPTAQEFRKMAGVEVSDGAILSAAKMHSYAAELSNEYDSKEDLMKPVYDLMVKGPDTSIPHERDFISEATDMLNSYVTEA